MNALIPIDLDGPRELVEASVSYNTRRAYSGALTRIHDWLGDRALTDEALAMYLKALFEAGKSPAVAGQAVAAVRFRAKLRRERTPVGVMTERVLAGYRNAGKARGRGQAVAMDWDAADTVAEHAATDGLTGLRDAALVAVMSDAMLRPSEAAAIDVANIEDGTLYVPVSKTDPTGKGATLFLGDATMDRVAAWQEESGIENGILFRPVYRGSVGPDHPMSTFSIRRILARRGADAGFDGITGHSARIGAAQSLARVGASVVEMQVAGRWKSPRMPAEYARKELAGRGAVARLRYGRG